MLRTRSWVMVCLLALGCQSSGGSESDVASADSIETVEAFRAAREDGDLEAARALLTDDPRIWYDIHEGPGKPWTLGSGRWKAWDEHFGSTTEQRTSWRYEDGRVWADMFEINDYFRLIERGGGWWRANYFLDGGRIAGFMVSPVPDKPSIPGRGDEFRAWARANDPAEAEYLMPGGSLDPTGDCAPRTRALANRWRASVGLAPVE